MRRPEERLCLTFDDLTETTTTVDGSGLGNHARVTGAMRTLRNNRGAITVDATSELAITQEQGLDLGGPMSFALWMDYRIAQNAALFDNHTQYAITQISDLICCNVSLATSPGTATVCQSVGMGWHHITCVKTNVLTIYVDGVLSKSVTADAPVSTGIADIIYVRIGQDAQPSQGTTGGMAVNKFDGNLEDVHVFARALELVEIVALAGAAP